MADLKGSEVPARTLHCYAEGRDGEWEAICLDLDIAVQGRTFEEVFGSLQEAISLYLETVADLPADQQPPLLHRPVPLRLPAAHPGELTSSRARPRP